MTNPSYTNEQSAPRPPHRTARPARRVYMIPTSRRGEGRRARLMPELKGKFAHLGAVPTASAHRGGHPGGAADDDRESHKVSRPRPTRSWRAQPSRGAASRPTPRTQLSIAERVHQVSRDLVKIPSWYDTRGILLPRSRPQSHLGERTLGCCVMSVTDEQNMSFSFLSISTHHITMPSFPQRLD